LLVSPYHGLSTGPSVGPVPAVFRFQVRCYVYSTNMPQPTYCHSVPHTVNVPRDRALLNAK